MGEVDGCGGDGEVGGGLNAGLFTAEDAEDAEVIMNSELQVIRYVLRMTHDV